MENISVIGTGRLGLGFALVLENSGFNVIGIDRDQERVDLINKKEIKTVEPFVEEFLKSSQNFHITTDLKKALDSEIIFILVNTPSLPDGRFDESQIDSAIEELVEYGKQDILRHVIISSTVNPSYCDSVAEKLNSLNYTVNYNPELLSQGSVVHDIQNPDMVIIGEESTQSGEKIQQVFEKFCKNSPSFHRMSRISAEIAKIGFNCFSTTKIAFANSIGDIAIKVGAEPETILHALGSDSKIGSKCFKYGFGYGGPCLPRDNNALLNFSQSIGMNIPLSKATDETNKLHLNFQFLQYQKKFKKDELIVFDGVTYKKGTTMLVGSQQLALAVMLAKDGYKVLIKDVPEVIEQVQKLHDSLFQYEKI